MLLGFLVGGQLALRVTNGAFRWQSQRTLTCPEGKGFYDGRKWIDVFGHCPSATLHFRNDVLMTQGPAHFGAVAAPDRNQKISLHGLIFGVLQGFIPLASLFGRCVQVPQHLRHRPAGKYNQKVISRSCSHHHLRNNISGCGRCSWNLRPDCCNPNSWKSS